MTLQTPPSNFDVFPFYSSAPVLLVNLNLHFVRAFLSSPYIGVSDGDDEAFMYCMGGEL